MEFGSLRHNVSGISYHQHLEYYSRRCTATVVTSWEAHRPTSRFVIGRVDYRQITTYLCGTLCDSHIEIGLLANKRREVAALCSYLPFQKDTQYTQHNVYTVKNNMLSPG
jgi:hypothetical protein